MARRLIALDEAERAMKRTEVILKAISGELKWYQAAEILGLSDRQMRRWKKRYEEEGYNGLLDRRRREPSPRRIPLETAEKVLRLYREEYSDFNIRHFHEELSVHGVEVSYSWTKELLQQSGLVRRATSRGQYRRRRARRPLPGMLVHLDGSLHRWFEHESDEYQTLVAAVDDATSELLYARFSRSEGTAEVLRAIEEIVRTRGTFISLYTDRASHFVRTPVAGEPPDRTTRTQVEQALDELGIELIVAYSPEARGRSERNFGTLQGRLPQELRRAKVTSYEAANNYLQTVFIPKYNKRFSVEPTEQGTAFIPVVGANLERICCFRHTRTVARDNTISFEGKKLQLPRLTEFTTLAGRKVELRHRLDGDIEILFGTRLVARFTQLKEANIEIPKRNAVGVHS